MANSIELITDGILVLFNFDGVVKSITDGTRRKCPWGVKWSAADYMPPLKSSGIKRCSGFSGKRQYM